MTASSFQLLPSWFPPRRFNTPSAGQAVTVIFALLLTTVCIPQAHADNTEKTTQPKNCPDGYILLNPGDYSAKPQIQCVAGSSVLTLKTGNIFSVTLPGNASTGASWALRALPAELMLADMMHQRAAECTEKTVGCGELRLSIFRRQIKERE